MVELILLKEEYIERCIEIERDNGTKDDDEESFSQKGKDLLRDIRNLRREGLVTYFRAFLNHPERKAYCILADGEIVGYITTYQYPDKESEFCVHIDEIKVSPQHQKKGYGTAALQSLFALYDEGQKMSLLTQKKLPAYKMYQKLGFYDSGKRRVMVRGLLADVLLQMESDIAKLEEENDRLKQEAKTLSKKK